jgi:virginiamycin B lyase
VPTPDSEPGNIVGGPDGALWFTEHAGNRIGRMTLAGAFTEYLVPTPASAPMVVEPGSDGALWFTEYYGNKIGRITTP